MEVGGGDKSNGNRKRKRGSLKKKIHIDEKVEIVDFVLVEEFGRWFSRIMASGKNCPLWKEYAIYCVYERGLIRPLPPLTELRIKDLLFGLCIDMNYQEFRWGGVIFDHCDGTNERSIFFPDLGDEMKDGVKQLRITQDGMNQLRIVSMKLIWYDVRTRKDFAETIREWTCNVKELWREMVVEVIGDYNILTLNEVRLALNLSKNLLKGGSSEPSDNVHCDAASLGNAIGSNIGIADRPKENGDSSNMLDADQNCGSTSPIHLVDGELRRILFYKKV
ncbi:hypothetical protein TSUD_373540 [Trifolium subterraneum]|uniref:Uncharacterized protein n=1 Tax=Trifolium subterraneum TaxID=3900 RepID=A0A2Z6M789_TRISU|nr:hypothetical protein TSUD_373540 [Trifolium subterraneum]